MNSKFFSSNHDYAPLKAYKPIDVIFNVYNAVEFYSTDNKNDEEFKTNTCYLKQIAITYDYWKV